MKPRMLRLTDRRTFDSPLWIDGNRVVMLEAITSHIPPFGIAGTIITMSNGKAVESREHPDRVAGMVHPDHPEAPTP